MKKKTVKKKEGAYSIEKLHHFRCAKCNKWWSIGDPSITGNVSKKEWFCPWCGSTQKMIKLK